jgi:TRAP-type C4-dicarboxylate transport system permease small subunit
VAEEVPSGGEKAPSKLVARLEATLGWIAAAALFAIMSITVVDVAGRYLFDSPLPSGYELIQFGMAVLVFLTLPILTARDEQVRIDAFEKLLPARLLPSLRALSAVISLAVLLGFAWLLWRRGVTFLESREMTATLRVPLAPFAFFIAASWAVAALIVAIHLARRGGRPPGGKRR